jgi:hypothetical protein
MRLTLGMTLTLLCGGCVSVASEAALCAATEKARAVHAAALVEDGGSASVLTGATLIAAIDAGCN